MKVAFSGCRDLEPSDQTLCPYIKQETIVLVGCCPTGVDMRVREYCEHIGNTPTIFSADWDGLGRGAGPERNGRMVREADRLVAFWDGHSSGTLNAIKQATRIGVKVHIVPILRKATE